MKRTLFVISLMLIVVFMLSACGGGKKESDAASEAPAAAEEAEPAAAEEAEPAEVAVAEGDAENGQKLYMMSCTACHGPEGKGIEGLGKDMTTSEFIADLSDSGLVDFIKVGRDAGDPDNTTGVAMLPKGGNPTLTDEQLLDIVAYVRSIHQ